MASIFSKIIAGDIPCYFIAEDEDHFAFLDIRPIQKGHVLVVPKKEEDRLFDLSPDGLGALVKFAQKVSKAIEQVIACDRVGVAVIGLEVPHAHIHLMPINSLHDMDFTRGPITVSEEEMKNISSQIADAFSVLYG